jgi:uncharacterized protein YjiS (DUF1127 family)
MITFLTASNISALPRSIACTATSCGTSLMTVLRRRQTYGSLSELDDRALRDIGLNRSMLLSVAIHGIRTARDAEPMAMAHDPNADRKPTLLSWLPKFVSDLRDRLAAPGAARARNGARPEPAQGAVVEGVRPCSNGLPE